MNLTLVPAVWSDVQAFIETHHRHHPKPVGMKFCLAVATVSDGAIGEIVGVATVGRPIARANDDGFTLEVNRSCVALDGDARNANSMLYGAAWRAAKALGYCRLITYTQAGESGASLRAAGWRVVAERPAHRRVWHGRIPMRGVQQPQRTLWEAS